MVLTLAQGANVALRFVLELAALGALAFWGFQLPVTTPLRVVAGVGAPLAAAVVWGLFAAPRAAVALPPAATTALQLVVLAAAVAALVDAGRPVLAGLLAGLAVLNGVLMAWWQQ